MNVIFAHDAEVALVATAALVNTTASGGEQLPHVPALHAFFTAYGATGNREGTEAELRSIQALRPRLRQLWQSDEDEVVEVVNALLREYRALPQLVRHEEWDYHLHATPSDAPLAARMAVDAAMALVDVIRSGELRRLRTCELPGCGNVMADLSKNRSKRFCDAGCGNRAAVTAYRARKAVARD